MGGLPLNEVECFLLEVVPNLQNSTELRKRFAMEKIKNEIFLILLLLANRKIQDFGVEEGSDRFSSLRNSYTRSRIASSHAVTKSPFVGSRRTSRSSRRGSSSGAAPSYRAQNDAIEQQLFSRIRDLEAQLAHGLPPQLNPGEYEHQVRENLESAVSVDHYHQALQHELFEVKMLELKNELQEKLFTRMLE